MKTMQVLLMVVLVGCVVPGAFACEVYPPGDLNEDCRVDWADFGIFAANWMVDCDATPYERVCQSPPDITWVYIEDPGVSGHEAFNGYMSKYETTNAQYCEYLNDALASGDIVVSHTDIQGAVGGNPGTDFNGQPYYDLAGPGYTSDGATNGGATRINWTGSAFTVDSGFEDHPVTYVSWYGATAFASYYGWRLPTEWEWQAVADYDGSYTYGCGTTINNSIANYRGSTHPHGTTAAGSFGTYGYGMADLAGNVWEWCSNCYYSDCRNGSRVFRGGNWYNSAPYCQCAYRHAYSPSYRYFINGFRCVLVP